MGGGGEGGEALPPCSPPHNVHTPPQAVQDVLAGLYNATMAKHPQARKLLERRWELGAAGAVGELEFGAVGGEGVTLMIS